MITLQDIQIFITTHNRADYFKASIESVLAQTAGVPQLTVLDNESTDATEVVVGSFASRGVQYVKTQGFLGNFNRARTLASQRYVMLFHDDDLLHPQHFEMALQQLNQYKNTSLITTLYREFTDTTLPDLGTNPLN